MALVGFLLEGGLSGCAVVACLAPAGGCCADAVTESLDTLGCLLTGVLGCERARGERTLDKPRARGPSMRFSGELRFLGCWTTSSAYRSNGRLSGPCTQRNVTSV